MTYALGMQYNTYNTRNLWAWWRYCAHWYTNKYDEYMDGVTNRFLHDADSKMDIGNIYVQKTNIVNGFGLRFAFRNYMCFTHPSKFLIAFNWISTISVHACFGTWIGFMVRRKKKIKSYF